MTKDLDIIKDDTATVVSTTLESLIEGLTGIATLSKKEAIFSISKIFQNIRASHSLKSFADEWGEFKKKGKIKNDYEGTEQHRNLLHELLRFLDNDIPDERRFSVLKKICLTAATEQVTDRDSLLPDQYMRICKNLSSGAILVLLSTYNIAEKGQWKDIKHHSARNWIDAVTNESNLVYPELVETYEAELMNYLLLSKRTYGDGSGIYPSPHYRLTTLGFELCKYIYEYENVV